MCYVQYLTVPDVYPLHKLVICTVLSGVDEISTDYYVGYLRKVVNKKTERSEVQIYQESFEEIEECDIVEDSISKCLQV